MIFALFINLLKSLTCSSPLRFILSDICKLRFVTNLHFIFSFNFEPTVLILSLSLSLATILFIIFHFLLYIYFFVSLSFSFIYLLKLSRHNLFLAISFSPYLANYSSNKSAIARRLYLSLSPFLSLYLLSLSFSLYLSFSLSLSPSHSKLLLHKSSLV